MTNHRHNTDKRVLRTKKAITGALFEIMKTKELSYITVSELTERANVNRRTFYSHYRSISDILTETENGLIEAIKKLLSEFDSSDFKGSAYKLFIKLDKLVNEDFECYFSLIRMDLRGVLTNRLRIIIRDTTFSELKPFNIGGNVKYKEFIATFIAGGLLSMFLDWLHSENKLPIELVANLAGELAANAVERFALNSGEPLNLNP